MYCKEKDDKRLCPKYSAPKAPPLSSATSCLPHHLGLTGLSGTALRGRAELHRSPDIPVHQPDPPVGRISATPATAAGFRSIKHPRCFSGSETCPDLQVTVPLPAHWGDPMRSLGFSQLCLLGTCPPGPRPQPALPDHLQLPFFGKLSPIPTSGAWPPSTLNVGLSQHLEGCHTL